MKPIEKEKIRQILIEFAALPVAARQEFLGEMNAFLFASPQRRRVIVTAWKKQSAVASTRVCDATQPPSPADV